MTLSAQPAMAGSAPHWIYFQPTAELDAASLARLGARVRVVSRWLHAVSVEADDAAMEHIATWPEVATITPVGRGRRPVLDSRPRDPGLWAGALGRAERQLTQLNIPRLHGCGFTGKGVRVGVLDTGFVLKHVALAHVQVAASYDFVNDDTIVEDESGDPKGQHNHGTLVLGLLAGKASGTFSGVAPDATYLLAKVDNLVADLPIEDDWWVAGLEWAARKGARVVSSSISFCTAPCDPKTMNGGTEATSRAAALAAGKGVLLLNSAGNTGPQAGSIRAPGDAAGVLAIGSVDSRGKVASNSARGPTADGRIKPDLVGPGVGIASVDPGGTDGYRTYNGTSVATPLVAGLAALLVQAFPDSTPGELIERLKSSGTHSQSPDSTYGWGLPQVDTSKIPGCGPKNADAGLTDGRANDGGGAGASRDGAVLADAAVGSDGRIGPDAGSPREASGGCGLAPLRSAKSGWGGVVLWVCVLMGAAGVRRRYGHP